MKNQTPKNTLFGAVAFGLVVFVSLGCGIMERLKSAAKTKAPDTNRPDTPPGKKTANGEKLFESNAGLQDFISQLTTAVGADNPNLLKLSFYDSYAMAEVQDPKKPDNIDGYTYRDGKLSPPNPVKILGSGKIGDNVFPLKDVNLDGLPALTKEVMEKLKDVEGGHLTGYVVSRGLPFSKDVRIMPLTDGTRKSISSEADKNAKLKKFEVR
ncbi:hypothetical protein BH10ACI2_BH10ACI2_13150 [soil metagenome]